MQNIYIHLYIVCIPEMERDRPGEESESAVENELAEGGCSPEQGRREI
jgi:hypothetical protein